MSSLEADRPFKLTWLPKYIRDFLMRSEIQRNGNFGRFSREVFETVPEQK